MIPTVHVSTCKVGDCVKIYVYLPTAADSAKSQNCSRERERYIHVYVYVYVHVIHGLLLYSSSLQLCCFRFSCVVFAYYSHLILPLYMYSTTMQRRHMLYVYRLAYRDF